MKKFLLVLILLLASGCATKTKYYVNTAGIKPIQQGAKLHIWDRSDRSHVDKTLFTAIVSEQFLSHGFLIVDKPSEADYFISFSVEESAKDYVETKPVYAYIPGQTYNYSNYSSGGNSYGSVSSNGSVNVVGTQSESKTMYSLVLDLKCLDPQKVAFGSQGEKSLLWQGRIVTEISTPNARRSLMPLAAIGANMLGKTTDGVEVIKAPKMKTKN